MKVFNTLLAVSALATFGTVAAADGNQVRVQPHTITVSCYRGPWRDTIWDHPQAVFIESLVAYGYSYPEAQALSMRICRDVTLVDDTEGLIAATYAAMAAQPPGARR